MHCLQSNNFIISLFINNFIPTISIISSLKTLSWLNAGVIATLFVNNSLNFYPLKYVCKYFFLEKCPHALKYVGCNIHGTVL